MATEQQLAQALSPYDPNYLQNLALGQGTPSLLGNTTKAPVKQLGNYELAQNPYDRDNNVHTVSPFIANESFEDQSLRSKKLDNFLTEVVSYSPTSMVVKGLNTLFGSQPPAPAVDAGTYALANSPNAPSFGANQQAGVAAAMQSMQDALAADTAAAQAANQSGSFAGMGLGTGDGGMGSGGGRSAGDSTGTTSSTSSDTGTGNPGESYFHGGKVNKNHLTGPDPKGPDDGYGALQGGEYVIKKAAVRKYGEGMLGKINSGKFAKR